MRPPRLFRAAYTRVSEVARLRRVLDAVRKHPRVRALARRHVQVLLSRGSTWSNVDGSLRLLAEDTEQQLVFGPWRGDVLTELLYWVPFVRWAQEHFSLDPSRLVAVSRGGVGHWYADACADYVELLDHAGGELPRSLRNAAVFRPEPVLELVQRYRTGVAAPRPLMKRARHVFLEPPRDASSAGAPVTYVAIALTTTDAGRDLVDRLSRSAPVASLDDLAGKVGSTHLLAAQHGAVADAKGVVSADLGLALLATLSGVPAIVVVPDDQRISEPDIDMCLRVVTRLGGSLTLLRTAALDALTAAF